MSPEARPTLPQVPSHPETFLAIKRGSILPDWLGPTDTVTSAYMIRDIGLTLSITVKECDLP